MHCLRSIGCRNPGCHLITSQVLAAVPELSCFKVGTASIFIQHTSGTCGARMTKRVLRFLCPSPYPTYIPFDSKQNLHFCVASLTINENADPDVRTDMETALNKIVPEKWAEDGASNMGLASFFLSSQISNHTVIE